FGAFYLCLRRMVGYGLFLALATLLPLSTTVISLPRYVFWQPVFLVGLAMGLSERPAITPFLLLLFVAGYLLVSLAWLSLWTVALYIFGSARGGAWLCSHSDGGRSCNPGWCSPLRRGSAARPAARPGRCRAGGRRTL